MRVFSIHMARSNENKSCMRVDEILLVKRARTLVNSHQNLNQLNVDERTTERTATLIMVVIRPG
jgi:hypothetical protein